jgi:hypothetical protein
MNMTKMQISPSLIAGTDGTLAFETEGIHLVRDGQHRVTRPYMVVLPVLNKIIVGGALVAYANFAAPAPHQEMVTTMMTVTSHGARGLSAAPHEDADSQVPSALGDHVYSPEYDHEVIFTTMLTLNVNELPEVEPQVRPAHFPSA